MATEGTSQGERGPHMVTFASLLDLPWWEGEFGEDSPVCVNLWCVWQEPDCPDLVRRSVCRAPACSLGIAQPQAARGHRSQALLLGGRFCQATAFL